jgi:hypothetical protein
MRLFLRNGPLRENNGPLKVLLTITVRHFTGSDACHIINNCKPLVLYNKNYTFRACKKYPGLSSVAAEKNRAGGRIYFLPNHI